LATCPQNIDGETHQNTFITAVCTLTPASVPISLTTFDTVAQVARKAQFTCSQVHYTVHLRRDIERGGRREVSTDMRRVNARALEALLVSPSVAKAS
jgi:hypothetical protein